MKGMQRFLGALAVLAGASVGVVAFAGDGSLRPVPIPGLQGKFQKLALRTRVYVDQPRTPAEMEEIRAQPPVPT